LNADKADTMEIATKYNPEPVENKWYQYWMRNGYFRSVPDDREPYTIVIPPPNVTGVLHMGHMLNNTIQDVLIRRARMFGKNACWVPGTDHASIATEAKVVAMLREQGINKRDLSREEFLKYAWEWKEKYGGIILEQLKKLGASCDWQRTRFTMENDLSEAVIDVFIDLYNKGYIYRGYRMVNWDPQGLTAVSDEEVIHKEVNAKLYYVKYKIEGADEWITIATQRPETIMGDTAVCVNPLDARYKHLHGKKVTIPLVNRSVNIITDEYVDIEFGTGALKVTPAHDKNDYELGVKHKLEIIDTLTSDGKLNEAAQLFIGEDRFIARKKIVKLLDEIGLIVKTEDIKSNVGFSERTDAVIEPRLSLQWFVKMEELAKPALKNVLNGNIKLIPEKFINTYRHWMENVRDWCISRQLWWGQRIPAWYLPDGQFVVAKTKEQAVEMFRVSGLAFKVEDIKQDEDVVDTWFSSWLWPISVFNGFKDPNNKDIQYYYPTNDLITAPEILFFWVARMIIAGYEYRKEKPFSNVYLTGIVRDKLGRKMSKSLGNFPDSLDLIAKYGADGVRVGMLLCSPAGNDLPFDESLCEQGRNFSNKIWNAFRLVKGWRPLPHPSAGAEPALSKVEGRALSNQLAVEWFEARLNEQLEIINECYSKYRISEALMTTYKLVWDDFCSWYLEMIKPEFIDGQAQPIDKATYAATIGLFEKLLKILHPFMPFITEEIWHLIADREEGDCIIISEWPKQENVNKSLLDMFTVVSETITNIRNIRKSKNISPKEKLSLYLRSKHEDTETSWNEIICKLANLNEILLTDEKLENAFSFRVKHFEFYIPYTIQLDADAERERIVKELEYSKGFLKSVQAKLSNERFISNAKPELVENEKKKLADAEAKIKVLEESLATL
jgi:valyl-tRNA synthetase